VEEEIVVVVSPNVLVDSLPMAELRRMFMLERRFWKPGQPATVIYPAPGSAARAWLLHNLVRGDEPQLRRMVLEKMYRGEIDLAPKVVADDEETLAFVASGKGLLALVPASAVKGAAVKTLGTIGRHPGGPGQPAPE
jgi:hypothetical protein